MMQFSYQIRKLNIWEQTRINTFVGPTWKITRSFSWPEQFINKELDTWKYLFVAIIGKGYIWEMCKYGISYLYPSCKVCDIGLTTNSNFSFVKTAQTTSPKATICKESMHSQRSVHSPKYPLHSSPLKAQNHFPCHQTLNRLHFDFWYMS